MLNTIGSRTALIGLTAFAAGTAIAAAILEGLVFTDFGSVVVLLGLLAGLVLATAALVLGSNPRTGALIAMLGGLALLLLGVVELALVGLVWQAAPPWQTQQPAWIQEFFDIILGALIGGIALRLWQPREGRVQLSTTHPA